MESSAASRRFDSPPHPGWAAAVWLFGGSAMLALDGHLGLANEALILVLVSAVASLWLPPRASVLISTVAVMAFNYLFVPPRGTFAVDLPQDALLLAAMLAVSWIVALLMARQRRLTVDARRLVRQAEQLRALGEALREATDPRSQAPQLQQALADLADGPVAMLLADPDAAGYGPLVGSADADEAAGLRLCATLNEAMGPGTGRHEEEPAWYLPLRGRRTSLGAAVMRLPPAEPPSAQARAHAQALCDQMGVALERAVAVHDAAQAREAAQSQSLRNTLLAAIAHDHRTPLATIVSAAGALHDQADRLSPEQRRRLAATIVDEAEQLARLTDNTLQLARLDTPDLTLHLDWEAAEEIVGTVMRRNRQRDPSQRLRAHVEPALPLLRCDAVLMVQLLDNLVDNALKYGGNTAPVEIVARQIASQPVIAVRDRGPGVPLALRERIFETFQRGPPPAGGAAAPARRGAGVGLAVCRAIARAHGGELRLRPRRHGGSAFELWLPEQMPPPGPPA